MKIRVCQKFCVNAIEHLTLHKKAEGGKRKGLTFTVFLCMRCVAFSALLFADVFPVIVLSFGVATRVTTCLFPLCMVALVATFSRCCVAVFDSHTFVATLPKLLTIFPCQAVKNC